MAMTREEAVELLCYGDWLNVISKHIGKTDTERIAEAMSIVGKALRPVSREQVEQMRGEWIVKHDKYNEITTAECSKCGDETMYEFFFEENDSNFCPHCGTPMTDEAMDMMLERLETLYEQ